MKRIQQLFISAVLVLLLSFVHCSEEVNSPSLQNNPQPTYIIVDSNKIYMGDDFDIPNPEFDDVTFTLSSMSSDTVELFTNDYQIDCYKKNDVYWNVSTTVTSISSACIADAGFTISGSLVKDSTDGCFTFEYQVKTFYEGI